MTTTRLPSGRLHKIKFEYDLGSGWVKMPLDAVMFNERLTGQARQLWAWLASKDRDHAELSWSHAEFKLGCGSTARRRSLQVLVEEGLISISKDGHIVTMHDPNLATKSLREQQLNFFKAECELLKNNSQPEKQTALKQPEFDLSQKIIDAWNECKPLSFAKMRVLSAKQKQSVEAHLRNLGLPKTEVTQFICSVCRGLAASEFWIKTVNTQTRTFKAVFGYGSPTDVKMKNVEDLYNDGDPSAEPKEPLEKQEYTPEQKALLEEIEVHNYEIDMNYNREEQKQRSIRYRDEAVAKLKSMGINVEVG
tara:strand:- start:10227 stop:11147 length:921 start_codon:yes stop_codon:yes gene_type:complete